MTSSSRPTPTPTVPVSSGCLTDAQLLGRFIHLHEERAFEEILRRHGALVFAAALRAMRDRHAAEDVFQATFLVLARDARKVRAPQALAGWLHGVAIRLARKSVKRRQRLRTGEDTMEPVQLMNPLDEIGAAFNQQVLDEELQRLPEIYREPLVRHFLEGLTYEQTAQTLGVSVGVIEGRLKRGKRELQLRLARRGVGLGAALGALFWSQSAAQAAVTSELISHTAAGGIAVLQGTPFTSCTSEAVSLAARETAMLTTGKTLLIATGLLLACAVGQGVGKGTSANPATAATVQTEVSAAAPAEESLAQVESPALQGNSVGELENPLAESAQTRKATDESDAEPSLRERVEKELDKTVMFHFPENPLKDVADFLAKQHRIPIRLDGPALQAEALTGHENVSVELEGIKFRSALKIALETAAKPLTYVVDDQGILITTRKAAGARAAIASPQQYGATKTAPVRVVTNSSAAEQAIAEKLDSTVAIEFPQNPLVDVLEFFAQQHAIPILLDKPALEEHGLTGQEDISLVVSEVAFRSALNLLVNDFHGTPLDYIIEDDVLKVTTREKANEHLETRIYDVRSLVEADSAEELIDVIEQTTAGPWQINGDGNGTISYYRGSLLIRQSQRAHREIELLLNNLAIQLSSDSTSAPADRRTNVLGAPTAGREPLPFREGGFGGK